jgi:primosomal protein N'
MKTSTTSSFDALQATSRMGVLMPALVDAAFDYAVPATAPLGSLVEATLGKRALIGVVWEKGDGAAPPPPTKKTYTLKTVTRVVDHVPPFAEPYRRWLDWIAEFTLAPRGAVLSLCGLSHAAKVPKKPLAISPLTITLPTLTAAQQQVADRLKEVVADAGAPRVNVKPILLDGVTGSGKTEVYFHAIAEVVARHSALGTWEEENRVTSHESRATFFKNQVLVLVPEIALTHQWLDRFEKTFGTRPIAWHSRMTPVAKARIWQAVARGEVPVVVGARSALFLPFKNLGLIIVDEEHDPSFKQEDGVLYHARDMAVVRAHFEQIPILLASATPSLETLENVRTGKYESLHLPERFGAAGLPSVTLVDMRAHPPERGNFLSPVVRAEMLATVARGEQVLLFLNRRGYAPLLLCRACGYRFQCGHCSAWLVVHGGRNNKEGGGPPFAANAADPLATRLGIAYAPNLQTLEKTEGSVVGGEWRVASAEGATGAIGTPPITRHSPPATLSCHHCGHREKMPQTCPGCHAEHDTLVACGPGVERIAEEAERIVAGGEWRVAGEEREQGAAGAEGATGTPPVTRRYLRYLRNSGGAAELTGAGLRLHEEALGSNTNHPARVCEASLGKSSSVPRESRDGIKADPFPLWHSREVHRQVAINEQPVKPRKRRADSIPEIRC